MQKLSLPLSVEPGPTNDQRKPSFNVACTHAPMAWRLWQLSKCSGKAYFIDTDVLVMQGVASALRDKVIEDVLLGSFLGTPCQHLRTLGNSCV